MRNTLLLSFLLMIVSGSFGQIRIFEVYGGGGNTSAPYTNDYVVLYNSTNTAVNLTGWTLQYSPATSGSWTSIAITGNIPAKGFFLVQLGNAGGGVGAALPTPDFIDSGTLNINTSAGKVAIVNSTTPLSGANPLPNATISDFVGYGNTASASETSPAPAPNNILSISRNNTGNDTDNNSADLTTVTPNPRNSSSTPLPVTLVAFKAALNSRNQAEVKWTTASELNNDYFEIQRSKNAIDFEILATIKGIGTTDKRNDYSFVDEAPMRGINYYRLKQIDTDGTYEYLRTVSVVTENDGDITIYPNPSVNRINFNFADSDLISEVAIYDTKGFLLQTLTSQFKDIDVSGLVLGKYIVKVTTQDNRSFAKGFVKE